MIEKKSVLVLPIGTEIGLEIWKALKECKDITLFSGGSSISNHGPYISQNHFIIPHIKESNWVTVLTDTLRENSIDYIFPAHDDIIVALAKNSDKFNAKIISSPVDTCLTCRSKTKTYEKFKNLLPVPRIYKNLSEIKSFPVFIKPDKGQGTQNAFKVNDLNMLKFLYKDNISQIVLEYLPGKEYTIDCFSDRQKGLLFCSGRERIRTKNGISMNSKPSKERLCKCDF